MINIQIDGRSYQVAPGTSVAAAVWQCCFWPEDGQSGAPRFRRSVGGESRAPLCGMGICFECRLTIDGIHHRRSCLLPCKDGMEITTDG